MIVDKEKGIETAYTLCKRYIARYGIGIDSIFVGSVCFVALKCFVYCSELVVVYSLVNDDFYSKEAFRNQMESTKNIIEFVSYRS